MDVLLAAWAAHGSQATLLLGLVGGLVGLSMLAPKRPPMPASPPVSEGHDPCHCVNHTNERTW